MGSSTLNFGLPSRSFLTGGPVTQAGPLLSQQTSMINQLQQQLATIGQQQLAPPANTPNASGPGWQAAGNGPINNFYLPNTSDPLSKPGGPTNAPSFTLDTGQFGPITEAACQLFTNPIARALCVATAQAIGGGGGAQQTTTQKPGTCPKGYHTDPKTGGCVIDGIGSYIPGDVGKPDYVWTPINGRYGAGTTPVLVQRNVRACPPGYVLGNDGVCYDHLARTHRAHNPGAKPLLTGGDMNALRRAHQLQKKIGKISRRFGPKPRHHSSPIGRKKR